MGITGSIIVYVMIWWIIFFPYYRLEFNQIKKFLKKKLVEWIQVHQNPRIGKKFLITTLITTIIFVVIYYLVEFDLLNLREFLQ